MALDETGVKFVSKGFGEFISNMSKAAASIAYMGNMTQNRLKALESYNTGMAKIANSAAKMIDSNAKIIKSNNEVIISNNELAISANELAEAEATAAAKVEVAQQNATARITESFNKLEGIQAQVALGMDRLAKVENVINLFTQGKFSANEFAAALNGINGKAIAGASAVSNYGKAVGAAFNAIPAIIRGEKEIDRVMKEQPKTLGDIVKHIGKVMASWVSLGAVVGTALGSILGALNAVASVAVGGITLPISVAAPIAGAISGALVGATAAIATAVKDFAVLVANKIISALEGIVKAIANALPKVLGAILNIGVQIVKTFYEVGKAVVSAIGKVINTLMVAARGLFDTLTFGAFKGTSFRGLGDSVLSAMLKFEILKQSIRKVVEVLKDFVKQSAEAAEEVQVFTIRLDNLIARQVRNTTDIKDYTESIKYAVPYTQDLLNWMRKMALETPVSVEAINQTTSLSMAMGWGVESAKKLTGAMVDYIAATGLSNDVMERIIYNFAQMKTQGKVTGTELRDLGRGAFMPINTVLQIMYENIKKGGEGLGDASENAKYASMSFEEFRDAASRGEIAVEGFFQAFIDYVNRDMPNAAKNMNFTIKAIKDNLSDLFHTFLGWDIISPALQKMWQPLQNFIEGLDFDKLQQKTKAVGKAVVYVITILQQTMTPFFQSIKNVISALGFVTPSIETVIQSIIKFGLVIQKIIFILTNFVNKYIVPFADEIGNRFGKTFDAMNKDFFSWGLNLIVSFANGIVQGVAKVLVAAMNFITKILTKFLKGSSPPRVAPDIDEWGAGLAQEYVSGMVDADYSQVKEVGTAIGKELKAGTTAVKEEAKKTGESIGKNVSKGISKGLSSALISMSQLSSAKGWLHSFKASDFTVLEDMKGAIKDVLSAMVTLGTITPEGSAKSMVSYTLSLIKALDELERTGSVSQGIFRQLASLGGVFGSELAELLDLELKYKVAEDALTLAKKNAADAQKAYDQAVKNTLISQSKLTGSIRKYNEMLRKGANRFQLKTQLKLVNATQAELNANQAAEGIAKTQVDITKEQVDIAQERVDIMKEQLDVQKQLMSQLTDLVVSESNAGSAAAKAAEDATDGIASVVESLSELEKTVEGIDFDALRTAAENAMSQLWPVLARSWNDNWAAFFGPDSEFIAAWSGLKTLLNPYFEDIRVAWDAMASAIHLPSWEQISSAWSGTKRWVEESYATPWKTRRQGGQEFEAEVIPAHWEEGSLMEKFQAVMDTFSSDIQENGGVLNTLTSIATYVWTTLKNELTKAFAPDSEFMKSLKTIGGKIMTALADLITGEKAAPIPNGTLGSFDAYARASNPLMRIADQIETWAVEAINSLTNKINGAEGESELGKAISGLGSALWGALTANIFPKAAAEGEGKVTIPGMIKARMKDLFRGPVADWEKFTTPIGESLGQGVYNGMDTKVGAVNWDAVFKIITGAFLTFMIIGSPSKKFEEYGGDLIEGLKIGMVNTINGYIAVGGEISLAITSFIESIKKMFGIGQTTAETNPFINIGNAIIDGIINGINAFKGKILTTIEDLGIDIPEWLRKLLEASSPSKVFMRIGQDTMRGLSMGISRSSDMVRSTINETLGRQIAQPVLKMSAPMQASPVYAGATVNFGDVHINNQMDWAVFKAQVQRAIIEG